MVLIAYFLAFSSIEADYYPLINFGFNFYCHFYNLHYLYHPKNHQYFYTLFLEKKIHHQKKSFQINHFVIMVFFMFA